MLLFAPVCVNVFVELISLFLVSIFRWKILHYQEPLPLPLTLTVQEVGNHQNPQVLTLLETIENLNFMREGLKKVVRNRPDIRYFSFA